MRRDPSWWIPRLYMAFAAALVPWTVYLAISLPKRSLSLHYRGTWVGFDIALIVVLAAIGYLAYRRDPRVVLAAAAGATLLLTDAWFDMTTAAPGPDRTQAVASALLLEIPSALLCAALARRGLRIIASRALAQDADPAVAPQSPDPA